MAAREAGHVHGSCCEYQQLMLGILCSANTDVALAAAGADELGIDDHVCTLAFTTEYS